MTAQVYVIDASVATKWFLREEASDRARELRTRADATLHVPEYWYAEVTNSIWKRIHRGEAAVQIMAPRIMEGLLAAPVQAHPTREVVNRAMEIAVHANIAVYDACYAAVAELVGGTMVTADREFARRLRARTDVRVELL